MSLISPMQGGGQNPPRHPRYVEGYLGRLEQLAVNIGNMQYDLVADFLQYLSEDLLRQAEGDKEKGRDKLYKALMESVTYLESAVEELRGAWNISEPYMQPIS